MTWIKQNLVLAVGGVVTLLLVALGGYYLYLNMDKNQQVNEELSKYQNTLTNIYKSPIFPSTTNITAAKKELAAIKGTIGKAHDVLSPVPAEKVTDLAFKSLLDTTLFDLQKAAEQAGVGLPEKGYAFSFSNEKIAVQFPPSSFPVLPEQLAEVKAICEILFATKINKLTQVRRVKVSDRGLVKIGNDPGSPGGGKDYLDMKMEVDPVLGLSFMPYEVDFESFSTELAMVLDAFSQSKYGLLVKAVMIDSEQVPVAPTAGPGTPPVAPPTRQLPPPRPVGTNGLAGNPVRPPPGPRPVRPPNGPVPGKDGLTTVLNEKLMKVTLLVESVRILPATK
jgi:hypothetical protein